jgi:hypothetical protein
MTIYDLYRLCELECKSGHGETIVCIPGPVPGTLMAASLLDFFPVTTRGEHYVVQAAGALEVVVVA